jgi:acetate kinase
MMGTRTGSIDPGVLLYLMEERGMTAAALSKLLYKESGLLGVSGISHDMRTLLASNDPRAKLAVELYVYRVGREIGSLAAALGGLDALVFTAGIGEHAAPVREAICREAAWLGVDADPARSRVAVAVIPTNEEEMIAAHTLEVWRGSRAA